MSISSGKHSEMEYLRLGEGPGLVLVHGTAGDGRTTWQPTMEALADRYTVLAPNLPGSGGSAIAPEGLDLPSVAAEIAGVAEHAGLESFHLAGYSLGAAIATQLASSHPSSVRSLLLVAGWLKTDAAMDFELDLWRRLLEAGGETFARFVLHTGMGSRFFELDRARVEAAVGLFANGLPSGTPGHIALDKDVDLVAAAGNIEAPTLVVGLTEDRIVPIHHARTLATALGTATFRQIDAGHLFPWEQPQRFMSLIQEFLATTDDIQRVPTAAPTADSA